MLSLQIYIIKLSYPCLCLVVFLLAGCKESVRPATGNHPLRVADSLSVTIDSVKNTARTELDLDLKITNSTKEYSILYVLYPYVKLKSNVGNEFYLSSSGRTESRGEFKGFAIGTGESFYQKIKIKFVKGEGVVCEQTGESLKVYSNNIDLHLVCYFRIADFGKNESADGALTSNTQKITYPFEPSIWNPSKKEEDLKNPLDRIEDLPPP